MCCLFVTIQKKEREKEKDEKKEMQKRVGHEI